MRVLNLHVKQLTSFRRKPESRKGAAQSLGYIPNSELFENVLLLQGGYIKTDEDMKTEISGVFAAGDIRVKSLRQVVTAAADGAIAATQAEKYLSGLE